MLQIAHPWLALILPLPLLVWWLLPAYRESRFSVRTPFFTELAEQLGVAPSPGSVILQRNIGQRILLPLVWLLVVAALVQPQWVGEPIEKIESARDLMLVLDLSGSMDIADFVDDDGERITRLEAVKDVLQAFVEARETDRLGLIVFGNAAFIQSPFTLDHRVLLELLDETRVGMAGPQTMLGDALGLAVKSFETSEVEQKTVVLLTDGNDTSSKVPPPKAAELCAQRGLTVHVIGVGDPSAAGETPLDIAALQNIADTTGGRFFQADDRQGLEGVSQEIDDIEPLEYETVSFRPTDELYFWPLGGFLVLALAYHLMMAFVVGVGRIQTRSSSYSEGSEA
ncbi:MAG: VWA domain-containing protein [bacterium]|nr:VWA domain-containing protein [bacterium]